MECEDCKEKQEELLRRLVLDLNNLEDLQSTLGERT